MNFIQNNMRRVRDLVQYMRLFREREFLYHLVNQNTIVEAQKDLAYKELEKEFSRMIESGALPSGEQRKSNIIWTCWFQGEENAPELVKACISSMRQNLPEWEVIVLSEKNISQYVELPPYIVKKWENKTITPAHYSDLLRISLLCKYGGIWADGTVLCTSSDMMNIINNSKLFVFQSMDLTRQDEDAIVASSWFISAWSNHPILLLTRDLLYEYWRKKDTLENYFIFHFFFAMASRRYPALWAEVPVYNNHSPHVLQFELANTFNPERWDEIKKMSSFHKLNWHLDYTGNQNTFYQYIVDNFYESRTR